MALSFWNRGVVGVIGGCVVVVIAVAIAFQLIFAFLAGDAQALEQAEHARGLWIGNVGVIALVSMLLILGGLAMLMGSILKQLNALSLSLGAKLEEFMTRITPLVTAATALVPKSHS